MRVVTRQSKSTWPYSCSSFGDPFDGVVMIVEFPDCWSGGVSGSLNGERVAWYVDSNVEPGEPNDLVYEDESGACPAGFHRIPRVSIHMHTLIPNPASDDTAVILPSSCADSTFPDCASQKKEPPATGPRSIAIGLASDAGTPGGWYTFHADYIQAWHMGTVTDPFSTSPPPDQDAQESAGTLNDLTEDCLDTPMSCGFQPGKDGYPGN